MVSVIFMQLSGATSIRDIAAGLLSTTGNLNNFCIPKAPSKPSISYLNKTPGYEVFLDIYFQLLQNLEPWLVKARRQAYKLKREIYPMDSTVIPLRLSLFDWAKFRTMAEIVKRHTEGRKDDLTMAQNYTFS